MKKIIVILVLGLFSSAIYSKPSSYVVEVFTMEQFKEGLNKLTPKEEKIEITSYTNKESLQAAFPTKKLQERWLNKTSSERCPKLVLIYVWELYTGKRFKDNAFDICADFNESVVSRKYDLNELTYTCYADKNSLLKEMFPNVKSDDEPIAEIYIKR
jgi:hypothetical protein